jgi:Fe-S cluster assembly protein SufD
MAIAQAKYGAAEALIDAIDDPAWSLGTWAVKARANALATFRSQGAPHRRDEYWKFTNPAMLIVPETPAADILLADEQRPFHDVDRIKLVFVDGVFAPERSDNPKLAGVEIESLKSAMQSDIHWVSDLFGRLEANGQNPVPRPLAALNTAKATTGFVLRVTGQAEKPVSFIYLHENKKSDALIHHVIKIEEGAELTVLENGPVAARVNAVMEVDVADGATFNHVRTQGRDHQRRSATHMFARLGKESRFKSFTLTVNGVMTRNEAVIEFTGDDAHATIAAASAGDGDFHNDSTVFVTHDAVNCESRQVFKKVLRNGATGVFQGKILVQPDAQKTDGYQISQALLLDDDSNFLAKPELEIYADDVACSHGSTCGALDETALFYLMSRGIPRVEAQDMLVMAFLAEAIQEVDDQVLAEDIHDRLAAWMGRRRD